MDIHISLDQLGLLVSIVVLGVASNWYYFRRGRMIGWDSAMYELCDSNLIDIDDEPSQNLITNLQRINHVLSVRICN